MNLHEKFTGQPADTRKRALFALVLALVIGFLLLPSPSSLRRFLPAAAPLQPAKKSPFDDRLNIPPRVVPPRIGTRALLPPATVNAPPATAGEVPSAPITEGPMPPGLLGKFEGRTLLKKRGLICAVSVETSGGEEGQVIAFSTLQCMNPLAAYATPGANTKAPDLVMKIAGGYLPVSASLSGAWQDGALHFSVVKAIGESDCPMTSAMLTPWATHQAAFEWEDGCGKGEILLTQSAK